MVAALSAKLPRTIRLDDTDTRVYERAAAAGEWAVPGTFKFWDTEPEELSGKPRQAFAHGFLGIGTFGWATVVCVATIGEDELHAVETSLAHHLVEFHGALPAAREELAFAASLCEHPLNTLLAVQREFRGEEIVESFKVVRPASGADHEALRIWQPDEEDGGT